MSGKELFDGMSYVSDRFLDEAEHKTIPKSKANPWIKWVSLAACLCIMVGTTCYFWNGLTTPTSTNTTGEQPGTGDMTGEIPTNCPEFVFQEENQTDGSILLGAQCIRTNGTAVDYTYPHTVLIRSRAELKQYYEDQKRNFDLGPRDKILAGSTVGFWNACNQYQDAYFAEHDLILVVLEESSGSVRHEVQSVSRSDDGWVISIRAIIPEVGTCDMAQWHLLLEIPKDRIGEGDTILVERTNGGMLK